MTAILDDAGIESLSAIAAQPPSYPTDVVAGAVAEQFGLTGDYAPLVSERDQNFCLTLSDGRRFVVKVTSLQEAATTSDFQIGALRHLEGAGVNVPVVVRTREGAAHGFVGKQDALQRLRVVKWVDGEPLLAVGIDATHAARFGESLGRLDNALQGYSARGDNADLLWNLQRAAELRPLIDLVEEDPVRERVTRVIDDFEARVAPALTTLPDQAIHGDANPENVLVTGDDIGFIDFGDMVRAPRILDVAIAAAYLRGAGRDPLEFVRPFIAGYHGVAPLRDDEIRLLFDLVRARLATTVTLLYWRLRDRPADDDYRCKCLRTEGAAARFLAALDRVGRAAFAREIGASLTDPT